MINDQNSKNISNWNTFDDMFLEFSADSNMSRINNKTDNYTVGVFLEAPAIADIFMEFPATENMSYWEVLHKRIEEFGKYVGRFSDITYYDNLQDELLSESVESLTELKFKKTIHNKKGGTIVCGSPGEVAPDIYKEDYYDITNRYFDASPFTLDVKKAIWTRLALNAPDQLRQRMAFALSQIFVIDVNSLVDKINTETNLYLYDIFVRNAFGNYRDLIKEISFSPKMAQVNEIIRKKYNF